MRIEFIRKALAKALTGATVEFDGIPVELDAQLGETTVIVTVHDTYEHGEGKATVALRIERL